MKIRLLPGQVVVREVHPEPSASLWTPEARARETRTHTGRVLAMGPPARLNGNGPEVPHGFAVGDLVQYHFTSNEAATTRPWPLDGEPAVWLPQENVDGVWEDDSALLALAADRAYKLATQYLGEEPLSAKELPDGTLQIIPKGYVSHVEATVSFELPKDDK